MLHLTMSKTHKVCVCVCVCMCVCVCVQVICKAVYKVFFMDSLVRQFSVRFQGYYEEALATDFSSLSLSAQLDYVKYLFKVSLY